LLVTPISSLVKAAVQAFMPNGELDASQANARKFSIYAFAGVSLFILCVYLLHGALSRGLLMLPDNIVPIFFVVMIASIVAATAVYSGVNADRSALITSLVIIVMAFTGPWLNGTKSFHFITLLFGYMRFVLPRHLAWRAFTTLLVGLFIITLLRADELNLKVVYLYYWCWITNFVLIDVALTHSDLGFSKRVLLLCRRLIIIAIGWSLTSVALTFLGLYRGNIELLTSNIIILTCLWFLQSRMRPNILAILMAIFYLISTSWTIYISGFEVVALVVLMINFAILSLRTRALIVFTIFFTGLIFFVFLNTTQYVNTSELIIFTISMVTGIGFLLFSTAKVFSDSPLSTLFNSIVQSINPTAMLVQLSIYTLLGLFIILMPLAQFGLYGLFNEVFIAYLTGWNGFFGLLGFSVLIALAAFMLAVRDEEIKVIDTQLATAKQYNESQTALLVSVGHDIRTPLNNILLLLNDLASQKLDSQLSEFVTTMTTSGKKLNQLMGDLIDIGAVEKGTLQLVPRAYQVVPLVEQLMKEATPLAEACHVDLQADLSEAPTVTLEGDVLRISQIVANLLSNAIKFSPNGQVVLKVSNSVDQLRFAVKDNGPGMDAATLQRIFNRFEQADNSLTRAHDGLGLGLSLCRHLAHLMGGELSAVSTPGQGSEFVCQLPLIESFSTEVKLSDTSGSTLMSLRECRLLIVEDDPVSRQVMATVLKASVQSLVVAANGLEALEFIEHQSFDLVLTDISMPQLDGFGLLQRMREQGHSEPVIAVTANALVADVRRLHEAGFDAVITKPIDVDEILSAIRRVLQHQARLS